MSQGLRFGKCRSVTRLGLIPATALGPSHPYLPTRGRSRDADGRGRSVAGFGGGACPVGSGRPLVASPSRFERTGASRGAFRASVRAGRPGRTPYARRSPLCPDMSARTAVRRRRDRSGRLRPGRRPRPRRPVRRGRPSRALRVGPHGPRAGHRAGPAAPMRWSATRTTEARPVHGRVAPPAPLFRPGRAGAPPVSPAPFEGRGGTVRPGGAALTGGAGAWPNGLIAGRPA